VSGTRDRWLGGLRAHQSTDEAWCGDDRCRPSVGGGAIVCGR
jgi:hypothetical protein